MAQPLLFPDTPYRIPQTTPRRMRELPDAEQPQHRLRQVGASALSSAELLEIVTGAQTTEVGRALLARFDGLDALTRATLTELASVAGVGPASAARIKAAVELGRRALSGMPAERVQIKSPADAANLLLSEMGALEQEQMRVILLDTRSRVIDIVTVYIGNINSILIRCGDLFREAIRSNSASIIVAHSHPSGDPSPSPEDVKVTEQLVEAGTLLDIQVLDHLVISSRRFVSLKERGLGFGGTNGSRPH